MPAILKTASRINNHQAFTQNAPHHLRRVKKVTYLSAARELENLGMVRIVKIRSRQDIIVKTTPSQLMDQLLTQHPFCSIVEYRCRYVLPIPRAITLEMRHHLVAMGCLTVYDSTNV